MKPNRDDASLGQGQKQHNVYQRSLVLSLTQPNEIFLTRVVIDTHKTAGINTTLYNSMSPLLQHLDISSSLHRHCFAVFICVTFKPLCNPYPDN